MSGTVSNDPTDCPFFERLEPRVLLSAGDLDPTFGDDGRVLTDFSGRWDCAHSIAIWADGKIVVAGSSSVAVMRGDFTLARSKR